MNRNTMPLLTRGMAQAPQTNCTRRRWEVQCSTKLTPALGALADVTSTAWSVLSLEIGIRVGELLNYIYPLIAAYCRLLPHRETHEPR